MYTDYLLTLLSLVLATRLWQLWRLNSELPVLLWGIGLLFAGLAAFFGGTYHGIIETHPGDFSQLLWKLSNYAIGLATTLMALGSILANTRGRFVLFLIGLSIMQLTFYSLWMAFHDDFIYVIYHYGSGMLLIAMLHLYQFKRTGSKVILFGIIITIFGSLVQQSTLHVGSFLDNNDLFHLIQLIAVYSFYSGARQLKNYGLSLTRIFIPSSK